MTAMCQLDLTTSDLGLRQALLEITTKYEKGRMGEQIQAINYLRGEFGHSIELVEEARWDPDMEFSYTCYQYAFWRGRAPKTVNRLSSWFDLQGAPDESRFFPNHKFVQYLMDTGKLVEISTEPAKNDDIILYRSNADIKHAGLVNLPMILSKWGLGHLWRHPVFEIPDSYGNEISIFRGISAARAEAMFIEYAKARFGSQPIKNVLSTIELE